MDISSEQADQIVKKKLGLRVGYDAGNASHAAYSMCSPLISCGYPVRTSVDAVAGEWGNSLWNTLTKILDELEKGKVHEKVVPDVLLIVTNCDADESCERYPVMEGGKGDGRTFPKCNRLPVDSEVMSHKQLTDTSDVSLLEFWVKFELF